MEDLAELGASSAKEHIKNLNKEIDILEQNRNRMEEQNNKLNYEIEEYSDKVKQIELNKEYLENRISDIENDLSNKGIELNDLTESNTKIRDENIFYIDQIDKYKGEVAGLELVYNSTKENLNKAIDKELEMNQKLEMLEEVLKQKEDEIKQVEELKQQAEKKAEEEYTIRRKVERSKSKVDNERKQISKDVIQLKRDGRKSTLRLMTVENLKKLVIDTSKITKRITKNELLEIIHEEEGLNDPILTPAKLVHSYSQSSDA